MCTTRDETTSIHGRLWGEHLCGYLPETNRWSQGRELQLSPTAGGMRSNQGPGASEVQTLDSGGGCFF